MNLLTQKTYNNQYYDVILNVSASDIILTSPSAIKSIDEDSITIPSESITYIMIENSMVDIIPSAEFEILDEGFMLTTKLKKTNVRFKLSISKSTYVDLNMVWIVKKFDIINVSTTAIHYKIWAELDCSIPLYTTCYYATSNDLYNDEVGGEDPFKIIKYILTNVGLKLYSDIIIDDNRKQMCK